MDSSFRRYVVVALLSLCLTAGPSRSQQDWLDYDEVKQLSSSSRWTPRGWDDDDLTLSSSTSRPVQSFGQLVSSSSSSSLVSQPWEKEWANLQRPLRVLTKDILAGIAQQINSLLARTNLAGYIRLIFHDCVGGCDGCINFSNALNRGLEQEVADLEGIYQRNNYEKVISRADFWAYASHLAVEKALANSQQRCKSADCKASDPGMIFRYGRRDCPTSPFTSKFVFIPGTIGQEEETVFFAKEFDFTDQETVAIMGAHNLALARTENSGHDGMFVAGQANLLNNNYYKALLKNNYVQKANTPANATDPHFQWNLVGEKGFMLNTDLGLWKNLGVDSRGQSTCPIQSCPLSRTSSLVLRYANNNDEFVRDFASAFVKMISRGSSQLFDIV